MVRAMTMLALSSIAPMPVLAAFSCGPNGDNSKVESKIVSSTVPARAGVKRLNRLR